MMDFTYYGHSCFSIVCNGKHLLFDPFISPNELAKSIAMDTIKADYILISHGHIDHIADAEVIATRTGATIITNWEIAEWYKAKGISKVHPMNIGGSFPFDFGTVKATVAQHSSGLPDGTYGGSAMGFIIKDDNQTMYYSGDTALTMDMQLISNSTSLNFAVPPIGDNFTMGITDAITAAQFIKCTNVIGVHYDTFGYIVIDKEAAKKAFATAGITLHLPAIGETITTV